MATFNGAVQPSLDEKVYQNSWFEHVASIDRPQWDKAAETLSDDGEAGIQVNGSAPIPRNHSGAKGVTDVDDFYYRVHVAPARLDLGNILNAQTVTIAVFNGFFVAEGLNGVSGQNTSGLQLNDPIGSYPYSMSPLEEIEYEVEISTSGGTNLNALYSFDFESLDIDVPITGSRVVVFPYAINWKKGFTEQYTWNTTVLRARDGVEQRFGLDSSPRKSLAYDTLAVGGSDAAMLRATLMGWHERFFALPVWADISLLTSAISAGATSIPVDTTDRNFFVGGIILLRRDDRRFETGEITSVNPGSIELAREIQFDWPAGSAAFPVNLGHLPSSAKLSSQTDSMISGRVNFSADIGKTDTSLLNSVPPHTYGGLEFLLRKPNWGKAVELTSESDFQVVDFDRGLDEYLARSIAEHTYRYEFVLNGKSDIQAFKDFLGRRNGKRVPFYMPTWQTDIETVAPIQAGSTGVVIKNNGYHAYLKDHKGAAGVYIITSDGSTYARIITGSSLNIVSDEITLSIDSELGVQYLPAEVVMVSYLAKCRLATDSVRIDFLTPTVARVQLPIMWVNE